MTIVLQKCGVFCSLFLLASILVGWWPAGATETGVCFSLADNSSDDIAIENATSSYEDTGAHRSLQDLLSDGSVVWQQLHEKIPSFGFSDSAFWLKINVCPSKEQGQSAVLEITYPLLDHIQVYGVIDHKIVYEALAGDSFPFSQRPVKHRNFVFFLPDLPQDALSLYIRVQTKSAMQIPLQLYTPLDFFAHNQRALLVQGLYFGIILAMVLYNAFVFVFLRELPYLLYVLFTTSYLSFQGVYQGISQQFLFDSVWLQNNSLLMSGFFSIFFAIWFAISFLKLPARFSFISRILSGISAVSGLTAMFASFFPYEIMIKLMLGLAIPSSLLIMFIGCKLWWVGHLPARIFTVAWSTLLVSFFLASLNKFGIIPRTFWTENVLQIGGLLEVILLSIALAERVNEEKRQRILAEQRLSTSLEEKVEERTKELNHALEQLEEANRVLSQISLTDSLTQIANRRAFDIQLTHEYKSATRGDYPLALVMVDIDYFKRFNDTYGHQVGDKVLRAVAKTLKLHAARPGDSVYRYGGEEFAVLLNNTNLAGAQFVVEKMRKAMEETAVQIHDRSFFVTISAGMCIYNPKESNGEIQTPEDLIHQADRQLYKAKEKGRNRVEVLRGDEPSGND